MAILVKPVVSEKMTDLSEKLNRYGFVVSVTANKIEIKKAVEKAYGVSVESVNTMNYGGKTKTRNTKAGLIVGKTNKFKKAIITVADGDVIDFYSNI
jgi:large subunit ribosomal protein L23|tara:strand:- start:1503 stop:1793 length:291 start_codon:yes stop_codon:yes gene_type:complete